MTEKKSKSDKQDEVEQPQEIVEESTVEETVPAETVPAEPVKPRKTIEHQMSRSDIEAVARAVGRVQDARIRAVMLDGHTGESDLQHNKDKQLAAAAGCLCLLAAGVDKKKIEKLWPFESYAMIKDTDDDMKRLTRAGSFLLAEIERLQRGEK